MDFLEFNRRQQAHNHHKQQGDKDEQQRNGIEQIRY